MDKPRVEWTDRFARWIGLVALLMGCWTGVMAQEPPEGEDQDLLGSIWVGTNGLPYRNTLKTERLIAELRSMPMEEVLLQVRHGAVAYYQSQLVPKALGLSERFDPLAMMIDGLGEPPGDKKVVAWFSPYHAGNENSALSLDPNHVLTAHEDWLSMRIDGNRTDDAGNYYLEPGLEAVQGHLEAVAAELVTSYDFDAICFDPVGEPGGGRWGFHPQIVERWQQRYETSSLPTPEDPKWMAYRTELIARSLEGLIEAVRRARPEIVVAIGVEAVGPAPPIEAFSLSEVFRHHHQSWPKWLSSAGVDRIYLKSYRSEVGDGGEEFDAWVQLAMELAVESKVDVIVGIAGRLNVSVDALAQMRRAAEAGAAGLALSDYDRIVRDRGSRELFLGALGRTVLAPDYPRRRPDIRARRMSAREESVATSATQNGALPLPPPPPPLAVEDDEGRMMSVTPQGGETEQEGGEAALNSPPPIPTPKPIPTRRELLLELLRDPRLSELLGRPLMPRDEESLEKLREMYSHIF